MQRDLNFFSVYTSPIDSGSRLDKTSTICIAVAAVSLVCVVGLTVIFAVAGHFTDKKTASIENYLKSDSVTQAQSALEAQTGGLQALNKYAQTASAEASAFSATARTDSSVLAKAAKAMPADVTISSVTYNSGVYVLSCGSTSQLSAAIFAHALTENGFTGVRYASVAKNGASYDFTITFSGNGGASK